MTVPEILEIPRKATAVDFYLSTVTGLAILLKQDPTTGVCVKTFQFLCDTSRRLLLNLQTIFIVSAPSFLPYLYVETRGGGGLTNSGFYVGSLLTNNALRI